MKEKDILQKEFEDVYTKNKLGDDEQKLISGLKKYDNISDKDQFAPFKLEVLFGSKRNIFGRNSCIITTWESGRMHRAMDSLVRWCGYADCHAAIRDSASFQYHVVCPKCGRESFISPDTKEAFIQLAQQERLDVDQVRAMPLSYPEYGMENATLRQIAKRLGEFWVKLDCKADILIKFSPKDIRSYDVIGPKKGDAYNDSRRARNAKKGTLRYSMKNIIKDLGNGASLEHRLFAALSA